MALRGAVQKLTAEVRRRRGYSASPWGIDLLLTDACNLCCAYCPIWGEGAVVPAPARFMDTGAALRFLDAVASFRPMIRLFGGEPFLHPEWHAVVARARDLGLACTAVTNGMFLERDAEQLVRLNVLAVGISLDTDRAVNDALRGPGTLAGVRRGLAALKEVKQRHGTDAPRVEIYTTVHEGTYAHLAGWAAELAGWGIATLRLQHLIWFSSAQLRSSQALLAEAIEEPTFFRREEASYCRDQLPAIDVERLAAELDALAAGSHPFRIEAHPDLSVDEMRRYYGDPEFQRRSRLACTTMESYAFVDPRGRLYPCLTLDMGNVFETPFLAVWNGPRFRAFRRLIRREKRLPLCHRCPDQ